MHSLKGNIIYVMMTMMKQQLCTRSNDTLVCATCSNRYEIHYQVIVFTTLIFTIFFVSQFLNMSRLEKISLLNSGLISGCTDDILLDMKM